ncbi:MAG: 2-succinyl-5-enolpyruvyl-6-hydroxy-3-cyclohexene-1-carboxylic-acid synthase [Candidatus Nanopelagicales bacterium]
MTAPSVAAGSAVIAALRDAGVRHLVVSPGSRSAPLARAAAAAEMAGTMALHVRLDERSAGFLAVGLAKGSGSPVAVMCTSGTAVANLVPAVVEARYAGVPLVVVTADRQPELRGRGAAQTIDQVDIFGRFPLVSRDLPLPDDSDWSARPVAELVATAVRARGPVHLNLPLRPPLVGPVVELSEQPGDPADPTWRSPERPRLTTAARGAFLVGDLDIQDDVVRDQIRTEAARRGWPIIAEASSGLLGQPGVVPGGTAALGDAATAERLRPQIVITVGPFGLDRGVIDWLRSADRHVSVRLRPRTDPPDPLRSAESVLAAVPYVDADADESWTQAWAEAAGPAPEGWGMGLIAATVWSQLTPDDLLVVASSSAIRALAASARGPGPRVLANRGANGIDGLVSTAWGAAVAHGGRTVALLGDLAFLHDTNGLLVPSVEVRPDLTYVVADSNGGAIFAGLEQGAPEYADTFERIFTTPHDRDLRALLEVHGVPTTAAADADSLGEALRTTADSAGVAAIVAPVSASGAGGATAH